MFINIYRESSLFALIVELVLKSGAALLDITGQCRIGTKVKGRNLNRERSFLSKSNRKSAPDICPVLYIFIKIDSLAVVQFKQGITLVFFIQSNIQVT